jgi:hypothetical protein
MNFFLCELFEYNFLFLISDPDPEEISTALTSSTTNYNNEDAISQYNTTLNSQTNYSSTSFDRYLYFKFSPFILFNLFNSF